MTLVNNLMNKGGIRSFCRTHCQGACCTFSSGRHCDQQIKRGCLEEPRLTCNVWLCDAMRSTITYLAKNENKTRTSQFINYYCGTFRNEFISYFHNLMRKFGSYKGHEAFSLPAPTMLRQSFSIIPCPGLEDEELIAELAEIVALLDVALSDPEKNRGLLGFIREQRLIPEHILDCYLKKD
jgi:hypothetical protein